MSSQPQPLASPQAQPASRLTSGVGPPPSSDALKENRATIEETERARLDHEAAEALQRKRPMAGQD